MFHRKILAATFVFTALFSTMNFTAQTAQANDDGLRRIFKVQVQYQDTECRTCRFWSTVLETPNRSDAEDYYAILLFAKASGLLGRFVPFEFSRYIPVDVRMRVDYSLEPIDFEKDDLFDFEF